MIESWTLKKIFRAFENKDIGTIQSLVLQQCINPNALIPSKGVSFLHLIIGHPSEDFAFKITKLFLRCGGDPNIQSSDGVTPIHVAAAWGRNCILHLLLVNGGDPWMQDDEKKNAFNYAFEEKKWNTIEMLHLFHRMHSAANCKQDIRPKYERSLERVLLKKGEEIFAYTPKKKCMKSMTTQTQSEHSVPSLVQDKIRSFEPVPIADVEFKCQKEPGKKIGWVKDFYQTSCEVIVHQDASENTDEKKETFVSSIHIDTSPGSDSAKEKTDQPLMDVRGQLFMELQEAVHRRSKLKMIPEKQKLVSSNDSVLTENDPSKDSFVAKEISYLYGVNLEENEMLKNMSDFATKVMNEIEVKEVDRTSEKTIDICLSSPDLTGVYLSCEEELDRRKSDGQILLLPQNNSDTYNLYSTPYESKIVRKEKEETSNESFMSVTEEYKYTDSEEGVVLLEKKLVITPTIRMFKSMSPTEMKRNPKPNSVSSTPRLHSAHRGTGQAIEEMALHVPATAFHTPYSFEEYDVDEGESTEKENASSVSSTVSTVPSSLSYNSDVLRCELNGLGYHPGPITKTTKKLYLKKLWRLKKKAMQTRNANEKKNLPSVHHQILERTLTDREIFDEIPTYRHLEEEMVRSFESWTKQKWREGTNKTSFNYLLLDPRVSLNLPKRASLMTVYDIWKCFLSGIFYVGKGKKSRPYAHLYKAIAFWEKKSMMPTNEKTDRIVEIWKEGLGVICLQVFHNTIPVEALTREAAMIDALGVSHLKNIRAGEYYGIASTWPTGDKIRLGCYLLHKAMLIFISEGERQIQPYDID